MAHREHLSKDKKLKKIMEPQEPVVLAKRKNVYLHLCSSIMSQQLNVKVAATIYNRFLGLYGTKNPSPQQILDTPFETLRSVGLSNAKVNYVQNVCQFFIEEKLTDAKLYKMDDDAVIQYLTQIKGVGQWTVEMILMFTLGREDVFAMDDFGIQQTMSKMYQLDTGDKKELKLQMQKISNRWEPYRTYACRYLWGWKDNR